jgi:hypothetical protein
MKKTFTLFPVFLLSAGCAMDMYRTASVRIEMSPHQPIEQTSVLAGDLFSNVADQFGFIVKGPTKLGIYATNYSILYTANAAKSGQKGAPDLSVLVDDKQIEFIASVYGSKENFAIATNAATLFEQECSKRQIQYKTFTGKAMIQGGLF